MKHGFITTGFFGRGFYFLAISFLFYMTASVGIGILPAEEMTVDRLLDLHQSHIAGIKNWKIEYETVNNGIHSNYLWSRSSECESLFEIPHEEYGEKGRLVSYFTGPNHEIYSTIATPKELDTFAPSSVRESLDSGINFSKAANDFDLNAMTPSSQFLFTSIVMPGNPRCVSLKEFVKKWSWSSPPRTSLNERKEKIWTIVLANSDLGNVNMEKFQKDKSFVQIDFNETKHFLVERMLTSIATSDSPMERQESHDKLPLMVEIAVTDYFDITDKISFPKIVKCGMGTPWAREHCLKKKAAPFYNQEYTVQSVKIDKDAQDKCLSIPEYAKVFRNDLLTNNGKDQGFAPVSFWGKAHAPQKTFLTENDYNVFVQKEYYSSSLPIGHNKSGE